MNNQYKNSVFISLFSDENRLRELYAALSGESLPLDQPVFIVLYNGKEPYPDYGELRLSDAFREAAAVLGIKESAIPPLQLTATVYNINDRHNAGILERSETPHAYSVFVDKARIFEAAGHTREDALELAIDWCIKHGVLSDYLRVKASEVRNMLFDEWNWDDAMAVRWEEGMEKGLEQSAKNLLKHGMTPAQIAESLELSPDTVLRYLRTDFNARSFPGGNG